MIEILVYGTFFLLMCTVGYLTLNALHKTHQMRKNPCDTCKLGRASCPVACDDLMQWKRNYG